MTLDTSTTFVKLVKQLKYIQIPILQRDYAQGRNEAKDVREQFLSSIKHALVSDNLSQPLDLDFVYGNFEGTNKEIFSVLDGQQRLTTLFLLHWYLAMKEKRQEDFQSTFVSGSSSRFTYKTRVSATEFFNALAVSNDVAIEDFENLSNVIRDKQWFFMSWQYDPTVQASLTMLDSIHKYFSETDAVMYDRLVNEANPRILFQHLNLESFGLSDELYIKMNARGKPLTDFENFKALLCSKLEKSEKGKRFEEKLDQQWTDVFWKVSQELEKSFDELYLKFFNYMIFFNALQSLDAGFDSLGQLDRFFLSSLRSSTKYHPAEKLDKFGAFNQNLLDSIEIILDYYSRNINSIHALEPLKTLLKTSSYTDTLKCYANMIFIQSNARSQDPVDSITIRQDEWTRVIYNLINNYRIDEMQPFIASFKYIFEYSKNCGHFYDFLVEHGLNSGFNEDQRKEEAIKARLIKQEKSWEPLLIKFEKHAYLQGKMELLLELADCGNGEYSQEKFVNFGNKITSLLDDKILSGKDFILERALLSLGDYLVSYGNNRYSLCSPNNNNYRDRAENWFKVIKGQTFKNLVLTLDNDDPKSELLKIIDNANCDGWRQLLINYPKAIKYCGNRLIYRLDDSVYLLSKTILRGYHVELRSYILYLALKEMESLKTLPSDIKFLKYKEVYSEDTPFLRVSLNNGKDLKIAYKTDGFYLLKSDEESIELPVVLKEIITSLFPRETTI